MLLCLEKYRDKQRRGDTQRASSVLEEREWESWLVEGLRGDEGGEQETEQLWDEKSSEKVDKIN